MPHKIDTTLLPNQVRLYKAIQEYQRKWQDSPTYKELSNSLYLSMTTVVKHIQTLVNKHYITHARYTTRGFMVVDINLTLSEKEPSWEDEEEEFFASVG